MNPSSFEAELAANPRAPLIADGLVRVYSPSDVPRTLAVASASTSNNVTTEQWFVFSGAYVGIRLGPAGEWGVVNTGPWPSHLPVSDADYASTADGLELTQLYNDTPDAQTFFSEMKNALAGGAMQYSATYVVTRYTVRKKPIVAEPPETNQGPIFLETMFASGEILKAAHFCASTKTVRDPYIPREWFRSRVGRAIWRTDKFTYPPDATVKKAGVTDDNAVYPSDWWNSRTTLLDPLGTAAGLRWARYTAYEYKFTDWTQLDAPPSP